MLHGKKIEIRGLQTAGNAFKLSILPLLRYFCNILNLLRSYQADPFGSWGGGGACAPPASPSCPRACSSSNILAPILKTSFFIASPAPLFFCSGKGGHNQGSAADSLMSPAKWITSHNFAGLSSRAVNYSEKPIAFCSKFSVQNSIQTIVLAPSSGKSCQTDEDGSSMLSIVTSLVFILIETVRLCADTCLEKRIVCDEFRGRGLTEWHPIARPCHFCRKKEEHCIKMVQTGWCSNCESRQKAFLKRLNGRNPNFCTLPLPDPPHNIKSVRSSLFWYLAISERRLNQYTTLVSSTP